MLIIAGLINPKSKSKPLGDGPNSRKQHLPKKGNSGNL